MLEKYFRLKENNTTVKTEVAHAFAEKHLL